MDAGPTEEDSRNPVAAVRPCEVPAPFRTRLHPAALIAILCALALLGLAGGCAMPGDAVPVVKIGLIAPFEGVGRPLGYAILPVVRTALAQANADGSLGRYRVALVALNDDLSPASAAAQARALAQDPDVLAVLGPFSEETAAAVAPILAQAGIPALVAAPLAQPPNGIRSLCPPPDAIAAALRAAAPNAATKPSGDLPFIFYPGDAGAAAEILRAGRAQGWPGALLGGPDVLRPWLPAQAGPAAEGTRAVACAWPGAAVAADELPEVGLARGGMEALLRTLAAAFRAGARPARPAVAQALAEQALAPALVWYQVRDGAWQISE